MIIKLKKKSFLSPVSPVSHLSRLSFSLSRTSPNERHPSENQNQGSNPKIVGIAAERHPSENQNQESNPKIVGVAAEFRAVGKNP
jgi:hypothetical protein